MLSRVIRLIGEIVAIALFGASILAVLSFLAAETPEQAIRAGHPPMPPNWEAGVLNHGAHYQWYTITAHPFLFALSVLSLTMSGAVVAYITRHWLSRGRNAS